MLNDDKKLQVTLNVFKNLNNGGSFDEQKLMEELKDLETRMKNGVKSSFLEEQVRKSKLRVSVCPVFSSHEKTRVSMIY